MKSLGLPLELSGGTVVTGVARRGGCWGCDFFLIILLYCFYILICNFCVVAFFCELALKLPFDGVTPVYFK